MSQSWLQGFTHKNKPVKPVKLELSEKRTNNKLNPHLAPGWNRTQAPLVISERSQLCNIPSSLRKKHKRDLLRHCGFCPLHFLLFLLMRRKSIFDRFHLKNGSVGDFQVLIHRSICFPRWNLQMLCFALKC